MRTLIKVSSIRSQRDINNINSVLGNKEGILACHIIIEKNEIDIVYDNYFIDIQDIKNLIEDLGYTLI